MKTKKITLNWEKLEKSQNIFPAMVWKKNGKAAILCGVKKTEESSTVAVIDPESSEANSPNPFTFLSKEEYEERLRICTECDSLMNGMCGVCGCYVEMRAAVKTHYCPDVKKRW